MICKYFITVYLIKCYHFVEVMLCYVVKFKICILWQVNVSTDSRWMCLHVCALSSSVWESANHSFPHPLQFVGSLKQLLRALRTHLSCCKHTWKKKHLLEDFLSQNDHKQFFFIFNSQT